MNDHWPIHARRWALVGPPLRPAPDDVARFAAEVARWQAPRALLLGVTPELATMRWPDGAAVVAVDRSQAMIDAIYPGPGAVRGDWSALPIAGGAIDVAIGDGCLTNLGFPDGYRAFAAELRRVLAEGGALVLRVFAAPDPPESLAEVAAALAAGRVASFHALKWRVAMAIQDADRTVAVQAIRAAVDALIPDRDALTAWPRAEIDTLDHYRDSDLRYSFPTLAEVNAALAADLAPATCHAATHRDAYPTVVWTPR